MKFEEIQKDQAEMESTLVELSEINSYSYNITGLDKVRAFLIDKFKRLDFDIEIQELELEDELALDAKANEVTRKLAKSLLVTKKSFDKSAKKVLLMGHMDTVFPEDSSFQKCKRLDDKIMNGPGVSDLKGGIVVMLKALEYFEKSPNANKIAWQVFLNSEEEIGSPGSQKLFPELAERNDLALIYEPSLSDGSIAYRRKGTGNYQLVVRGKSAHVGREFDQGASAIRATAEFIEKAHRLNSDDVIINFGKISGGGPLNVVPDLCITGINVRIENTQDGLDTEAKLQALVDELNAQQNISAMLYGKINRQPKIPNQALDDLFKIVETSAEELGQKISRRNTGGCCDGNNLYEYGLVNIDTMGVRGGKIHSSEEFICLESLSERARLTALVLDNISKKYLG